MARKGPGHGDSIVLEPVARRLGWVLVAMTMALWGIVLYRATRPGSAPGTAPVQLAVLLAISVLPLVLADLCMSTVEVGRDGVTRHGILGIRTSLLWSRIRRVTLHRGRGTYREARIGSSVHRWLPQAVVHFSSLRVHFRPALRRVIALADEYGVPVTPTWFSGTRGEWEDEIGLRRKKEAT